MKNAQQVKFYVSFLFVVTAYLDRFCPSLFHSTLRAGLQTYPIHGGKWTIAPTGILQAFHLRLEQTLSAQQALRLINALLMMGLRERTLYFAPKVAF